MAERIPETVQFYTRRTIWLAELLQFLAFEMSAEAVSRVAVQLRERTSPDAVLRLVRRAPVTKARHVRVLGVDDWTFKKGQHYGTMLVDLENHCPIELLPDRTQDNLQVWLGGTRGA